MRSGISSRVDKEYEIWVFHSQLKSTIAFTLIELLVVIAILGILAALLLPAVSSGKNKAAEVVDMNNFKEIITATTIYAGDHGDSLPWPNWEIGDSPTRQGWLYTWDATDTGPARFKVKTGAFWTILRHRKLYFCPLDHTNTTLFRQRHQQISSYVMNGAIIGYNRTNYPPEKLGNMRPDDVAFWETDERHPQFFNDGASYPSEGVSTRHHQGAINVTFGGSVSYIGIATWYIEAADTNKNNLWCYPGSRDGR